MEVKQLSEKQYRVKMSQGETWYDVFVDRGKAACTCQDFVFRGMNRPCKHIRGVYRALSD